MGNGYQYLIKWKGFGEEDNTWEPRSSLNDDSMLREWHQQYPAKPSPFGGDNVTNMLVTSVDSTRVESASIPLPLPLSG